MRPSSGLPRFAAMILAATRSRGTMVVLLPTQFLGMMEVILESLLLWPLPTPHHSLMKLRAAMKLAATRTQMHMCHLLPWMVSTLRSRSTMAAVA